MDRLDRLGVDVLSKLSTTTPSWLSEREETLESCLTAAFVTAGNTLREIKDNPQALKAAGYTSFEEYVETRWQMGKRNAERLILAASTYNIVTTDRSQPILPTHETIIRPLTCLPIELVADAWTEAVDTAEIIDGKPKITEAHVRAVVLKYRTPTHEPPTFAGERRYRVIYADPPWKYSDGMIEGYGAAEHHYPPMTILELCDMHDANGVRVEDITLSDAVLFFWVTSPLLEACFEVIRAWGFTYKTSFVWDKIKHNFGHYNSVRHELLLVCTKGSCLPDDKTLHDSVVSIERSGKHSEKPQRFREIIDSLYPPQGEDNDRIELFSRKAATETWDAYGNQLEHATNWTRDTD